MYIGTANETVLLIENEIIVNKFNGCGGNSDILTSIVFDNNSFMATNCDYPPLIIYLLLY